MGQGKIINYLRKCKFPKTAKEIARGIGVGVSTVNRPLRVMRKHREIGWIIVKGKYHYFVK